MAGMSSLQLALHNHVNKPKGAEATLKVAVGEMVENGGFFGTHGVVDFHN